MSEEAPCFNGRRIICKQCRVTGLRASVTWAKPENIWTSKTKAHHARGDSKVVGTVSITVSTTKGRWREEPRDCR